MGLRVKSSAFRPLCNAGNVLCSGKFRYWVCLAERLVDSWMLVLSPKPFVAHCLSQQP